MSCMQIAQANLQPLSLFDFYKNFQSKVKTALDDPVTHLALRLRTLLS